jgi:hypothetical protein
VEISVDYFMDYAQDMSGKLIIDMTTAMKKKEIILF